MYTSPRYHDDTKQQCIIMWLAWDISKKTISKPSRNHREAVGEEEVTENPAQARVS